MVKYVGAFQGTVNTTDFIDATVTVDDLTTGAARKILAFAIADLGAGDDLAEFALCEFDVACTILAAKIVNGATTATGVDAGNTSVHLLNNGAGGSAIVTKTYNNTTTFPTANTADDLGTLANTTIAANGVLTYTVTNGATANLGPYTLVIEYE